MATATEPKEMLKKIIPVIGIDATMIIYNSTGAANGNINRFLCIMAVLEQGFDAEGITYSLNGQPTWSVNKGTFQTVNVTFNTKRFATPDGKVFNLRDRIKKTKGWKQMHQDGENSLIDGLNGVFTSMSNLMTHNPATGPTSNTPPLASQLLNKIHPEFTNNIERFCNSIRTRSYLALPAMAFGSLRRVVSALNGVLRGFQRMIGAVYQGVIKIIKMFYSYINGIIQLIKRLMMWVIEQIIPLDLICLILEAAQILLDDIKFFTSIFSQSASLFNVLNVVQSAINTASSIFSNPLSFLAGFLPPEVKNIIDTIDKIGEDPDAFITEQLQNYGMGYVADALHGDLLGSLASKYGGNNRYLAAINAISGRLEDACPRAFEYPQPPAASWNYGSNREPIVDSNLNPIDGVKKIFKQTGINVKKESASVGVSLSQLGTSISDINPSRWVQEAYLTKDGKLDAKKIGWQTNAELEAQKRTPYSESIKSSGGVCG
jgi:hypothetical protein